jgi:predicted nucleic acid-binding protein
VSYLLDTNVVSEERKKERMSTSYRAWRDSIAAQDLYLSVLVIGELRRGIELLRRRDPRQAAPLDLWLSNLERAHTARIIPIDAKIADLWGRIQVPNPLPAIDGLLVATAMVHDLVLVTRNIRDVEATGVRCHNPF